MIRECIESGSRKFGMCVHQVGGEDYSEVGTCYHFLLLDTLREEILADLTIFLFKTIKFLSNLMKNSGCQIKFPQNLYIFDYF